MTANTSTPNRASLLAGLRTGGVRSASNIPHTAAPGQTTFTIPRVPSLVLPEEDNDQAQTVFVNHQGINRTMPMTAAVDGFNNRFMQQQQQRQVNPNIASFSPAFAGQPNHVQAQALQMQMMQLEMMRMQAIQAQQHQAQIFTPQNQPQSARRPNFNPPATAGPTGSFDLRSATLSAQMRRNQRAQEEERVPMTAALNGKFGVRPVALGPGFVGRFPSEECDDASILPTLNSTSVISGGTSLGNATPAVSKSEAASNWRRGGNNNSVLRGANRPSAMKTPLPPTERHPSPPPAPTSVSLAKSRPHALSINSTAAQTFPAVAIEALDGENDDAYSTSSSDSAPSNSPPTTPHSSSSVELGGSPSKDATAKATVTVLGHGRPTTAAPTNPRFVSQPTRQPHGPPSGPDELGPRNFATRLTRAAAVVVEVAA